MHNYLYANAAPVMFVDPSGMYAGVGELNFAVGVLGLVLQSAAISAGRIITQVVVPIAVTYLVAQSISDNSVAVPYSQEQIDSAVEGIGNPTWLIDSSAPYI